MNTYEGKCKYCGQIQPVMASSEAAADEIITRKCECGAAQREMRVEQLRLNINDVAGEGCGIYGHDPLEARTVDFLNVVAVMVMDDEIQQASITTAGTKITISANSKGAVRIRRTSTQSISTEC